VIRVPAQDRGHAIDLLQQHDAHELVRPGERTEGELQIGLIGECRREAVRTADHERDVAPAIVPTAHFLAVLTSRGYPLLTQSGHAGL
jgi:hypothetical protein